MSYQYFAPSLHNINTRRVPLTALDILSITTTALQRLLLYITPAVPDQPCSLLQLPPEMRAAIYQAALLYDSDSSDSDNSVHLLQTCRQINMEAQPVLYQRPKSFSSQARFLTWIDRSSKSNLERVRTLILHLSDVDLSSLLDQGTATRSKNITAWSLYQAELERLEEALRVLPNLASLTITPPKDSSSMLLKGFYRSFLAMIPGRCPKLKKLELHDSAEILDQVPSLKGIEEVTFLGSSTSSARTGEATMPRKRDAWVQI